VIFDCTMTQKFTQDDFVGWERGKIQTYGAAIGLDGRSVDILIKSELLQSDWFSFEDAEEKKAKKRRERNLVSCVKSMKNKNNPAHIARFAENKEELLFNHFVKFIASLSTDEPDLEMKQMPEQFVKYKSNWDKIKKNHRRMQFFFENAHALIALIDKVGRSAFVDGESTLQDISFHFRTLLVVSTAIDVSSNHDGCVLIDRDLVESTIGLSFSLGRPGNRGRVHISDKGVSLSLARYFAFFNPSNYSVDHTAKPLNFRIEESHVCGMRDCVNFRHLIFETRAQNLARVLCSTRCICLCECTPKCLHVVEGNIVSCAEHPLGCPLVAKIRERIRIFINRLSDANVVGFYNAVQNLFD